MIINKEVVVKPNNHSINHYLSKGYDAKCKKELLVKVEDLSLSSNVIIECKCDICGNIKFMKYQNYRKDFKNLHYCDKCKWIRADETKIKKYGNKYYNNHEKYKNTMKERYGGFTYQNKILKEKIDSVNIKKYGTEIPSKNIDVKEKIKLSISSNFSNENIKKSIIDKRKNTCLKKYGVDSYTKTDEYKKKSEKTCKEKYGYRHNGSVPEFIEKRNRTKILRHIIKADDEKTNFYKYKRKVLNITRKYKKMLFDNWDGYDFYDGEFIAENFLLKHTDKLYPSLDHKLSIYYGYENSISPEKIGDISNLCITKRGINSRKKDSISL